MDSEKGWNATRARFSFTLRHRLPAPCAGSAKPGGERIAQRVTAQPREGNAAGIPELPGRRTWERRRETVPPMKPFAYAAPKSLAEALAVMAEDPAGTRPLAG